MFNSDLTKNEINFLNYFRSSLETEVAKSICL